MLNTSGDVLNIVLAVSVASLTIFLCIAIYYFIASIQSVYRVARKIELGVLKAEETLDLLRGKLKDGSAYLLVLGEVAKQALKMLKDKQTVKKSLKKK